MHVIKKGQNIWSRVRSQRLGGGCVGVFNQMQYANMKYIGSDRTDLQNWQTSEAATGEFMCLLLFIWSTVDSLHRPQDPQWCLELIVAVTCACVNGCGTSCRTGRGSQWILFVRQEAKWIVFTSLAFDYSSLECKTLNMVCLWGIV